MSWRHLDSAVALLSFTWHWYLEMRLICGVLQMLGEWRAESSLCVRDGGTGLTSLLNWKGKSLQAQRGGIREEGETRERCDPLGGNVILRSSAPYTHTRTHTGILCRCAGWCTHAKKDECLRNKNKRWTSCVCICVSAYASAVLTCMLVYMFL